MIRLFCTLNFVSLVSMNDANFPTHYLIAIEAAMKASETITEIYRDIVTPTIKADGSPVTIADLAASKIIADHLIPTGIPILGEETEKASFEERLTWTENWCVDPLDGTKMFLQRNGEFSVNIAHIVNNQATFGIIASPVHREILVGGLGFGCFLIPFDQINQPETWQQMSAHNELNDPMLIICSHSYQAFHGGIQFESYTKNRAFEYVRKGSALKFFDLARGAADIYPRFAPTMEWDIAAGHAILNALGGTVVNAHTLEPLTYNKEDLFNPHFIAKTKAVLS